MPIKIPNKLPAREILNGENIFVIDEDRALHQDIRALKIAILNLMPTKIATETQLLRLLGNSPLHTDITLLRTDTHQSKNTSAEHLLSFYQTFEQVKHERFDGLIITGAPVENLPFEEVDYWEELKQVIDWSVHNVFSTFFICWGAQAGLHHKYGIPKYPLATKQFGVFEHRISTKTPICCADLTTHSMRPIRAIQKSGGKILKKYPNWKSLPNPLKQESILFLLMTENRYLPPAIRNMTH